MLTIEDIEGAISNIKSWLTPATHWFHIESLHIGPPK